MSDIVKCIRQEPYWVGGSQQQSEGESSNAPFEAADLIERQRDALRVARNALLVSKAYIERRRGGFSDTEPEANAIAAIEAALDDIGDVKMEDTIFDYFTRAEKNGVIDFSLRIVLSPEGALDFYIYPTGKDGETGDFTVNGAFVSKLDVGAGSSRRMIKLVGSGDDE